MRSQSPFALTPWVRRLILANGVVYVLALTLFTGHWFADLLEFSPRTALHAPWTFVTYMFVHFGFLHLAFNMLMLFVFGPAVEDHMGRTFAAYYLLCGLGGAACSFLVAAFTTVDPFGGASAAVLGVALAYAYYWPDAEMYVFPLPFPIQAKWLVGVLATIDFALAAYLAETGGSDGTAHLAHLGGLAAGLAFLTAQTMLAGRARQTVSLRETAPVLVHPAGHASQQPAVSERVASSASAAQEEVDRVLDKISANGLASLTPEERRFLDDQSRRMRGR